jgi:hypothetical protein
LGRGHWLTLLDDWSWDGWALGLFLCIGQFMLEFFTGFFELAHALTQATGKGREFLGSEENKNEKSDNDHLRSTERAKTGDNRWSIHGWGIFTVKN